MDKKIITTKDPPLGRKKNHRDIILFIFTRFNFFFLVYSQTFERKKIMKDITGLKYGIKKKGKSKRSDIHTIQYIYLG